MASQFAPQQHPIACLSDGYGACWTFLDALATPQAAIIVDDRDFFIQVKGDCVFFAYLDTCFTKCAFLIRYHWLGGPDNTHVLDLGLGTGVGAISQCDSKLVMVLQAANNVLFQEGTQLRFLKDALQPLHKFIILYCTIGTSLRAKTGLNLIPFDLITHILLVTLLGGFYFV